MKASTVALALFLVAGTSRLNATDYTWILTSGSWSNASGWSPNGSPAPSDNVVNQSAASSLLVNGGTQTVTNWTNSSVNTHSVIGQSGAGGTLLNITGTLAKSGAGQLLFRNSTSNPLSLSVGRIELAAGSLVFGGPTTGQELNSFTASSASLTGGSMFFVVGATAGTAMITGDLSMSGNSTVSIRHTAGNGQSGTLAVGSLTSSSGTAVVQVNATAANTTTGVLSLNNTSGTTTYAGILRNGGSGSAVNTLSVVKNGAGTQVFSGSSTYSGSTTINVGTLLVTGTHGGGGTYTVDNGGTLGGTGRIGLETNKNIFILNGGKLQASSLDALEFTLAGTGEMDVSGALGGVTSMFFTLGAPASTVIMSNGVLNIGTGVLNFNDFAFTAGTGFGEGTYTLFGGASSLTGTLGSSLTGSISGLSSTISLSGNDVILTVVPEPATWALLAGGLTISVGFRRRRR